MITKIFLIILYIAFLAILYVIIIKRLWYLNRKHTDDYGIIHLKKSYKSIVKIILVIIVAMWITTILAFLTFF